MSPRLLRLAVPKGRLTDLTLAALRAAAVIPDRPFDPGRRLIVPIPEAEPSIGLPLELVLLRNIDVPTWVEHGAADLGVCGTDVLDETAADVLRPFTFPFGSCRVVLAARENVTLELLDSLDTVRVATKYIETARRFLLARGWNAALIHLNGSVELAAALGLADAIIDLVETGSTLRENRLEELVELGRTRVKLVAHPSMARHVRLSLERLVAALSRGEVPEG